MDIKKIDIGQFSYNTQSWHTFNENDIIFLIYFTVNICLKTNWVLRFTTKDTRVLFKTLFQ